jgi:hypothetical protein
VDRCRFDADPFPDPDPTFHFDADPDLDPTDLRMMGKSYIFYIIHSSTRLHGFIFLISDVGVIIFNILDCTVY